MLNLQADDALFKFRGQGCIGRIHVDEESVPALCRSLQRIQHAGLGRLLHIRHVSVPDGFTVAKAAYRLAVLKHVAYDIYLR
jgi:hypothetical protein